jgi:hypothetical protein
MTRWNVTRKWENIEAETGADAIDVTKDLKQDETTVWSEFWPVPANTLPNPILRPDPTPSTPVTDELLIDQTRPNVAADLDGFSLISASGVLLLVCPECNTPLSQRPIKDDLGQLARRALAHECPSSTSSTTTSTTSHNDH